MQSGLFAGATDWHCHLLPGVDDGVQELQESLDILQRMEDLGFRELWLTPHIMEDMPNATVDLSGVYKRLQMAHQDRGGTLRLHLGAEYMLDTLFEERLAAGDLLPLGPQGRQILVETRCFYPPLDLSGILHRILTRGYVPVLAHPERYVYLGPKDYKALKDLGLHFQLNLGSLVGVYGSEVRRRARHLLTQGFYDRWGTDLHAAGYLERLAKAGLREGETEGLRRL